MKFQDFFKHSFAAFLLGLFAFTSFALAQRNPTVVANMNKRQMAVAGANNLYCAGYLQTMKVDTSRKIVGAVNEQEQNVYTAGNYVYINVGASGGAKVGDLFAVIRPRGQVETRWTKKGDLGFYVQEVGALEVVNVKNDVAVAMVKASCDNLLLGDLLQAIPARTSPMYSQRPRLDLFSDANGKATGRIVMARDTADLISRDQIVYIDLGSEDGVNVGDYLTVYRPLGKGNIFSKQENETVSSRDEGFQSETYRGGKFSNQAARKSGDEANGQVVTTEAAKKDRPANLRKVVGEMVILNVQGKTATAVITRTAQEIHPGDWVELQ